MGKKFRCQGPVKPAGSRDIGDLLLRPSRASGTFAPKENGDSLSASSTERVMDVLDEIPDAGGLHHPSSDEDELPSTKGDIKALFCNIRRKGSRGRYTGPHFKMPNNAS
ncbi:Hypothetical predicted protein [Pelobates cultripes]|uniref:Uncharacterized protein n=1 Tax=Pelobates cultripes TaxID=61616 RepID=A0AAD1TFB8_PELCU|nr:Hypothetical predicted protein [Pelobates cultripes]